MVDKPSPLTPLPERARGTAFDRPSLVLWGLFHDFCRVLRVHSYLNYSASISSLEEGGYLVEYPDLPGCIADGETIEQALKEGEDAVRAWIATAQAFDDPVPILEAVIIK